MKDHEFENLEAIRK